MNEKRQSFLDRLTETSVKLEERNGRVPFPTTPSAELMFVKYQSLVMGLEGFTPDDDIAIQRLNKYFERVEACLSKTDDELFEDYTAFKTNSRNLTTEAQVFCLRLKSYYLKEPNAKGRAWLTYHEGTIRDALKFFWEDRDYFSGDYLYLKDLLAERKEHIEKNYHVPIDGFSYQFPFAVDTYNQAISYSNQLIDEALKNNPSPKYCTQLKRLKTALENATNNFLANAVDGFLHEGQDYQMRTYLGVIKTAMDYIMTHPNQAEFDRVDGIRETQRAKAMLNSEIK